MIRRFYVMPLRAGAPDHRVRELLHGLKLADSFIPDLFDSGAGLDLTSRTVLWENNFTDEACYAGPYMVHPYHVGTLDDYLMADSPQCLTQDIFTVRYAAASGRSGPRQGIRRLVLMKLAPGADVTALQAVASNPHGPASAFCADEVGWVSPKGRAWTHILEQTLSDHASLSAYLQTRDGVATSSLEGIRRLGVEAEAIKVFAYPFALGDAAAAPTMPEDGAPCFYTVTAQVAIEDAETFGRLLRDLYDPYMIDAGARFVHRWRTLVGGYPFVEIQSAWELASAAAYSDVRMRTSADPRWSRFVLEAMPLVRGGTRRFQRAVE